MPERCESPWAVLECCPFFSGTLAVGCGGRPGLNSDLKKCCRMARDGVTLSALGTSCSPPVALRAGHERTASCSHDASDFPAARRHLPATNAASPRADPTQPNPAAPDQPGALLANPCCPRDASTTAGEVAASKPLPAQTLIRQPHPAPTLAGHSCGLAQLPPANPSWHRTIERTRVRVHPVTLGGGRSSLGRRRFKGVFG